MKKDGFFERVYDLVREVPFGKVTTYGQIAKALGTKDARRVGQALHANPYNISDVACHRVVNKEGGVAKNFAFIGSEEQVSRLKAEGVGFVNELCVDLDKHLYILC